MKKRVCWLLVAVMLLSMLPVAVSAAETGDVIFSGTDVAASPDAPVTHTWVPETDGTLTVRMSTAIPGWKFWITDSSGNTVGLPRSSSLEKTYTYEVSAGETYTYTATGFNSSSWDEVAANITYTLSFLGQGGDTPVEKAVYEVSGTKLQLGDNTVALLDTAVTTIYVFEPAEMGVYTFTAPAGSTLGYWGAGSWFLADPHSTTNTYEWTCTGVGQTAYIGISNVDGAFNLNVEKTGTYTPVQIIEEKYENKAALAPFTVPAGAKLGGYVDVMGDAVHTAVLGEDGYYHLDSADGDVLIVDFDYQDIILSAALKSDRPVMNAYVTNENGDTVKYDIGDAVLEYEAVMDGNGYYPVTEDVLMFYQVYAMGAGTFTYHLTGMNYNEECVWMYCMRTMNMDNVVQPEPEDPTEPSEPETQPTAPSEPETEPTEPAPTEPAPTEPAPTEPVSGTVVLDATATADSGTKYTHKFAPTTDGTLTVTVGDGTTNWVSDVWNASAFKVVVSSSGKDSGTYTAELTANTNYYIRVYASGGALAETPVYAVFTPAGGEEPTEPSEPETEPTVPETEPTTPSEPSNDGKLVVTNEEVTTAGYTYTYSAATAGTLHVSVGDCAPGWRYKVTTPDGIESLWRKVNNATTECDYSFAQAGNWKVVFYAYDAAEYENVAGTVSFTITFTPDGSAPEIPTEPSEPETQPTEPSEPETQPTEPSEPETQPTEPSKPETEPTEPAPSEPTPDAPELPDLPVIPEAPANAYYSITVDGNTTFYTSSAANAMNTALSKVSGEGYLKFYQDMNLGSSYTIDVKKGHIIVDLNGCTITSAFMGAGALYVDGGNVTLLDSSAKGDGIIQNTNKTGMGIEIFNGSVTMMNGTVISGASSQGVKIWNSSSFTMYGGYVSGYNYGINVMNSASATIYGGTIENTKPGTSFVYPLYAASTTTISISGGYFKGGAVSGTGLNGKISGGYFSTGFSENYLATDCTMESNSDPVYLWVVVDPNAQPEAPVVPVAKVGDTEYTSIADAIAACGQGQYIVLIDNVTEDITVTGDLYLDLNGKTLTGNVMGDGTLYAMDSATDDYNDDDMGGIVGSVMCNVPSVIETDITGQIKKYMTVAGRNGVTFHRFYVGITAVSLNPANTGFGYKAEFRGDATVQAMVQSVGFDLWLTEDCVVTRSTNFQTSLTLRLNNFQMEKHGETPVNAKVFMTLADGTKLESTIHSYSMRQMLESINADWAEYDTAQQKAVQTMCETFYDVVSLWDLDNIFAIINIPIH